MFTLRDKGGRVHIRISARYLHRREIARYEKEISGAENLMKRPRHFSTKISAIILHKGNLVSANAMRFEFKPKQKSVNLRISNDLLDAVRKNAKREGIPYQRYIRQAFERAVAQRKR